MEYESLVNTSTSIGAQSEINLGPGLRHRPLLRGHQVHHLAGPGQGMQGRAAQDHRAETAGRDESLCARGPNMIHLVKN